MLESLKFHDVGPAPELEISFHERLNFLTGDNGLGKSFLLDVAWWALTRTWARGIVMPHPHPADPSISYSYGTRSGRVSSYTSKFDREAESWSIKASRPSIPGLVVYAQVDGGFSVWDPARNYWKKDKPDRPKSYVFTAGEVWEGNPLCEGLIRDWASWQRENGPAFRQLKNVLRTLSPSPNELLEPGELRRVSLDDPKSYPTLKMYGQEVPLIHASAGMRRVVALAYILVWTWQEHLAACELRGDTPTKEIIFLVDEIEAHLHPQWQRRIVPAVLAVMQALTGELDVEVQLITATHSPMVLVSTESTFDPDRDAIWELDLNEQQQVTLSLSPWRRHGDANAWLTSSVFKLQQPRSIEAEAALSAALELLRQSAPTKAEVDRVNELLRASLSDVDRFWVRWTAYRRSLPEDA